VLPGRPVNGFQSHTISMSITLGQFSQLEVLLTDTKRKPEVTVNPAADGVFSGEQALYVRG
jgi:hypothetical protein